MTGCASDASNDTETSQKTEESQKGEEVTTTEENKTYEIVIEELIIKAEGKEIYGKIYKPKDEGKYPAVILSHGYNGCNADFVTDCKYFARNGYVAYAFDFSGGSTRSKSKGATTDMTIFTEKEDVLVVFDYIKNMDIVKKERVFLFGGSQGGLVTAMAAEERKDEVKAMILYFPAFNIPDNWRGNYPTVESIPATVDFWGLKLGGIFFKAMHDYYPFESLGAFDKNVLIIQGDKDDIVPLSYAKRVEKLYKNTELVVLPGEGHGFTAGGGKKARERVLEFMKEQ